MVTGQVSPSALRAVAEVPDPEIPVLTIEDLGILRGVDVDPEGRVSVRITPTYSGCPAMDAIRDDVLAALAAHGHAGASVEVVLSPAWTTDDMSEAGRRKLQEYGIAPPSPRRPSGPVDVVLSSRSPAEVRCPRCLSGTVREVSRFGSTACKSLWVCQDCREPFDHFKTI